MRVLLLTGMYPSPESPLNGCVVKAQKDSLEKLGIRVDLCHLRANGRPAPVRRGLELFQMRGSHGYDLLHLHYGLSATLLGFIPRLPVVATYHGTDINGYPLYGVPAFSKIIAWNAAALITRQLSRYAAAIIVMTEQMKARLPDRAREKAWVLPMGIDLELFRQAPRDEARRALGWGTEPVVLFCDNNREPVKRQDAAETAVSLAQKSLPDVRLQVLRDVPHENMPLVLSAADCLLIASDREGSPNIVKEALACNLPVVSVDVGDVAGLLRGNPAAGRIVPRDPARMAEALVDVLSRPRPDNLDAMVLSYGLAETARRIQEVYAAVLESRSDG